MISISGIDSILAQINTASPHAIAVLALFVALFAILKR